MERMYTQALSIYLLSVNWWWERRFLRSCLMLRVWQLFLLFPSVVVLVDALKCLNYDLTKKKSISGTVFDYSCRSFCLFIG